MLYGRSLWLGLLLLVSTGTEAAEQPGVTSEEVRFTSQGVTLVGTLFQPDHPRAAVVTVHGSGQEKRMATFANRLAKDGIAVLTYDKRGVGDSGGVYAGPEVGTNNIDAANLELLARDAAAAVDVLAKRLPGKKIPVGLIGFSQAGWVIPLASKANPSVTFMVLFSGPVVTAREQLRFQFYTKSDRQFWDTHTEADANMHTLNDPDRYEFADTDPVKTLASLSIPGLWLFGGKDVQAPVALSIERLTALHSTGKPYTYKVFPTLGHNLTSANAGDPVDTAVQWITARQASMP